MIGELALKNSLDYERFLVELIPSLNSVIFNQLLKFVEILSELVGKIEL